MTHSARRHPIAVALRRSERTITTILGTTAAAAVALIYVIFQMSDLMDIPYVGPVLLVLLVACIALLVVVGIPWLIIRTVRGIGFGRAIARGRRTLPAWAEQRGWSYTPRARDDDAARRTARSALVTLKHHDHELRLPLGGLSDTEKLDKRIGDLSMGSFGGKRAIVFAARGLPGPVFSARFVAVESPHSIPALSVTDRHSDELWVAPRQQFESERFNERWRVVAKDPRYGSAVVHQQVLELFVGAPLDVDRVDIADTWIVSWIAPDLPAEQLDDHLGLLERVADEVPRFVREDYRA